MQCTCTHTPTHPLAHAHTRAPLGDEVLTVMLQVMFSHILQSFMILRHV